MKMKSQLAGTSSVTPEIRSARVNTSRWPTPSGVGRTGPPSRGGRPARGLYAGGPSRVREAARSAARRHLQVVPHLLLRAGCTEGDPEPYLRWPVLTRSILAGFG